MSKQSTYFDAAGFERHCEKIAKHEEQFAKAIQILRKEGMDVSAKELRTWVDRFGDFGENDGAKYKQHFVGLYKQSENRAGWLPMEERQRMFDSYLRVFKDTRDAASYVTNALIFGCIIKDTDEGAAVDVDATEADHKKRFIIPIHADKMEAHWNLLIAAKQAIDTLKEFEAAHGMQVTMPGTHGDYNNFGNFINGVGLGVDNIKIDISREAHDKAIWHYFKA